MDYKEKYETAIERLRNAFYDNNGRMCEEYRKAVIRIIEPIFPELKESSEDEKFRKYILKCCEETIHADDRGLELSMDTTKKLKNWLEKQGEKVEPIESFNSEFERQISQLIASIINKEHEYTEAFVKWTSDALLNYAKHEIEKQGEKTPVIDFKAKDWYVSKVDGKIHNMTYDTANKTEPKFKIKYAGNEYNVLEVKDIAGVSFYGIEDEPNHIDYVKAENCEIISGYAIKENGSAYPTNPAEWSEENETILNQVITNYESGYLPSVVERDEIVKKLKSLKDRVQLQPKWSEKDKNMLNSIIDEVMPVGECPDYPNEEERKYYYDGQEKVDWLKSLKERYTWRPSDEQMDALHYVINFDYGGHKATLVSLYEQLKKLK